MYLAKLLAARDDSTKADAIEALFEVAKALDVVDPDKLDRTLHPLDAIRDAILGEIEDRREKHEAFVHDEEELRDEVSRWQEHAGKLETGNAVREIQAKLDAAEGRLDAAAKMIESYSDVLAMARTFVTRAEDAGLKTRHAREVKRPVRRKVR